MREAKGGRRRARRSWPRAGRWRTWWRAAGARTRPRWRASRASCWRRAPGLALNPIQIAASGKQLHIRKNVMTYIYIYTYMVRSPAVLQTGGARTRTFLGRGADGGAAGRAGAAIPGRAAAAGDAPRRQARECGAGRRARGRARVPGRLWRRAGALTPALAPAAAACPLAAPGPRGQPLAPCSGAGRAPCRCARRSAHRGAARPHMLWSAT